MPQARSVIHRLVGPYVLVTPYEFLRRHPIAAGCIMTIQLTPGSSIYGSVRAAAQAVDKRIGWSRVGLALSLAIIAAASLVLYRTLHDINLGEVFEAIESFEIRDLVIAGAFVAAGYLTLTFYDLFALRTIGHGEIPYRVAALASFTSYSIGHNIGASVFTGGAVRYRIYSLHGLSAVDVAKLCFIAGLTFWLGNATVLGLGILYTPRSASAIDQLPIWLNRTVRSSRSQCSPLTSPGYGDFRAASATTTGK